MGHGGDASDMAVPFKRDVYRQVLTHLQPLLAELHEKPGQIGPFTIKQQDDR